MKKIMVSKKSFPVYLNQQTYLKFKIKCLYEGKTMNQFIRKCIEDYIKKP